MPRPTIRASTIDYPGHWTRWTGALSLELSCPLGLTWFALYSFSNISASSYLVPTPVNHANRYPRLTYSLLSLATHGFSKLLGYSPGDATTHLRSHVKRAPEVQGAELAVFATLIPVLVLLSGLFAGLTLGYMSLDETQLHVLSISGTE